MSLVLGILCVILGVATTVLSVIVYRMVKTGREKEVETVRLLKNLGEGFNRVQEVRRSHEDYEKFSDTVQALVLLIPTVLSVSREIENFGQFYEDTIEDVDSVIKMLNELTKRQTISDDPDVQNFYRIMAITHDTLLGYRNAGRERKEKED